MGAVSTPRIRLGAITKFVLITLAIGYALFSLAFYFLQANFIFFPQPERVAPSQDYISAVEIGTEDGETLVAWYSPTEPGCPTMLFFHGNASRIDRDIERYARIHESGVGFLALAWRGYAGSTGKPSEAGFYKDADAAWHWLKGQGTPAGNIIIHGFSIGTGPATKLASRVDEGALVLEAPYYSMQDLVALRVPLLPTVLLLKHRFRSDERIAAVGSPVLMAHGTIDSVIPHDQSKRLFELAVEPKTYAEFEGSEHVTLVRDGLYDRVMPFIATNWSPTIPVEPGMPSECYLEQSTPSGETNP